MALIKCTECESDVSDKAASCIKCGAPIGAAVSIGSVNGVVTTQQTSKKYKFEQIIAVALICAGMVSCQAQSPKFSAILFIIGVGVYVHARFGSWWNNG